MSTYLPKRRNDLLQCCDLLPQLHFRNLLLHLVTQMITSKMQIEWFALKYLACFCCMLPWEVMLPTTLAWISSRCFPAFPPMIASYDHSAPPLHCRCCYSLPAITTCHSSHPHSKLHNLVFEQLILISCTNIYL